MDRVFFTCFVALMALHVATIGCIVHIARTLTRIKPRWGTPWWIIAFGLLIVLARKVMVCWHIATLDAGIRADDYLLAIVLPIVINAVFLAAGVLIFRNVRRLVSLNGARELRNLADTVFLRGARRHGRR